MNTHNGQTEHGLTFEDITAMSFYKAAYCMVMDGKDPLDNFANVYADSYFVTETQAYNATMQVIWYILHSYGIPYNDITQLNSTPLGQVLYTYSKRGSILEREPMVKDLSINGDLKFTYNPEDGKWHSGELKLQEPSDYNGLYRFNLPKGMTAKCEHLNYVYGNEPYEIISDHQPKEGESFGIEADFSWLVETKQYSPTPDIEVGEPPSKFQRMIGAVIRNKTLSMNIPIGHDEEGSLSITNNVIGEEDRQKTFEFTVTLPGCNITGKYGDLDFEKGVSVFRLRNGETKTATHLPVGAKYIVKEEENPEYRIQSTNDQGTITLNQINLVKFTNIKLHDLTINKEVTGETGDKTKAFTFNIQLKDKNGVPVEESFSYIGSIKNGSGQEVIKPADGVLDFQNGMAEIALKHGQQITLQNLPSDITFTVIEQEANQDNYTTTYNGKRENASGTLDTDASVEVVNNKEAEDLQFQNSHQGNPPESSEPSKPSKPNDTSKPVKTGDTTHIMTYVLIAAGALLMIGALVCIRRHNHKNNRE